MFAETVIGYIDLIEHKIPHRSYTRELNAALHLSLCFHLIDRAHDRSSQKRALSEQICRWALWNKGEKIIGLMEEAVAKSAVKVQRDFRSSRSMPLTRDTFNNVIESVASKSLAVENDIDRSVLELPAGPYTFELMFYEQERRRLRVFSLIYGISAHKRALDQWRIEASNMPLVWPRLAQQYYGIDIEQCEFALIDPLLSESQRQDGIWALADLDRLIDAPGVAEKVLGVQEALREELIIWLGDTFAETEAEQARLIDEEIAKIAVEALDKMSTPKIQILTPDNGVEST
ncbi:hypothetical protein I6H96_09005 [Brucella anthropi]|uniref:Uncharacterized protein n=1 Tax=Brucella anthropi (strain ATCC 49188 / DSM 6882 / CCUG 24695 / JCM 21032 / LMG 3331 / NBRC 15819 / NCTC 12168 / Alc 37) TaxID=439375 RepID=A6WWS1_BRUA4|nr:hypothetical protein [Brucella anthropi]ABS13425.1 hypothetical protein Oant_0701 [Brucella anthropi ATCC 49188]NKC48739.1 hypothetical protein [Brucella anthropi ATCC 49188]QQC24361.1 hypothetical protein I6H96_09005 [Brucella anthropi]SUA61285.1 Uncharacterised protein [Brucella anthropi]